MKYLKRLASAYLFLFLIACSNSPSNDDVLSPEELAPIIEDIHLTDAMLQNERVDKGSEKAMQYYQYIYEKHGITREQFDASMAYYSKYPSELREAYTDILKNLEMRDSLLKAKQQNQVDTLQLWEGSSSYKVEKYTTETLPVCVPVKYQKSYTISAELKIYDDSQVKEITPYFAFEAPDTLYVLNTPKIVADTAFQKIEVTALVTDSTVTDLGGDFFPAPQNNIELFKHYEIRNIQITTTQLHSERKQEKLMETDR